MKKTYEKFEMEVFVFDKEDVLVASGILPVKSEHDNAYVDYSTLFDDFFMS